MIGALFLLIIQAVYIAWVAATNGRFYPDSNPDPKWNGIDRVDCTKSPDILSYHFHVTYMFKQDQIEAVQALRDEATKHFAPFLGDNPVCQGTPHDKSGRFGKSLLTTALLCLNSTKY